MGSHARCDRSRVARWRHAAACAVVFLSLAACHLGELLSSPGAGGEHEAPGTPLPGGARMLSLVSGNDQRDTVEATLATPYAVRVSDGTGRSVSGVVVRWSIVEGGGTTSVTQSTTDGGGVARATHTFGTAVGPQVVEASVPGLATSRRFSSIAQHGRPQGLTYEVEPSNSVMGERIAPGIRLVIRDRHGNLADAAAGSGTISLVEGTGTPLAGLSGTLAVSNVAGRLLFDDVRVSLAGIGYRVRVSFSGLASQSAPFDVALIGAP
jgi:hypothetical protein